MPRIYSASPEEIKSGKITDVYFERTKKVVEASKFRDTLVRMEVHAYSLPRGYEWAVFAGLEEALAILEGKPVNVYSVPEGTIFRRKEPLMVIEGRYRDFGVLETAILGVLRFSSSIATKAARIKAAAGDKTVLYFGLRALHPAVAPAADRAAYIGGVDGVSGVEAREYLGLEPRGTMPHALIILFGDQREAWKNYAEMFGETIALVDTFYDERIEAVMAAETLGEKLVGVRLDTPGSRRGRMRDIAEEVRWALDLIGRRDVKIIISGGIDEDKILELRDIADGFGVGTAISAAPSVDLSMDIVEVKRGDQWVPITKRGKMPGFKQLYLCPDGSRHIAPWGSRVQCPSGGEAKPLLEKVMEKGRLTKDLPRLEEIRRYVLEQLKEMGLLG
jgi:nicotinate phosphoribosyltransferase